MGNLILQAVKEENLKEIITLLESKKLLVKPTNCKICGSNLQEIGGFLPQKGKVVPICNKIECTLKASFLVMKHNGNGSPIIEE